MRGDGWKIVLGAVVLGLVLANARDCDGSRDESSRQSTTTYETTEKP